MAKEVFGNLWVAQNPAVVGAPAPGTVEVWAGMVQALGVIPALAAGEQLRVVENDDIRQGEIILVTAIAGGSWTVVRGAEGTTPVAHPANASYVQTVTATQLAGFQTKTIRVPHVWTVSGPVQLTAGDQYFIPAFAVPAPAGQLVKLAGYSYWINSGSSVTVTFRRSPWGSAWTNVDTGISVTAAATRFQAASGGPVPLSADEWIQPVVTAIAGNPNNMTFTVLLDYTVGV